MPHLTSPTMILAPTESAPMPPYVFRKRNERVDWRKIAAADPDRITREVDFKTLQENINNVTFCDVESEVGPDIDPNYIKLFKLAQLTIEYLLNSQQYLTDYIGQQESQLEKLLKESSNVSVELDKDKKELDRLKKECHKRKKLLAQQQQVLFAGGPGSYFKCPKCPKAFINESFLHSHLDRKHPDYHPKNDFDELKRESEELKAELDKTRRELEEERKSANDLRRNAQAHEESETNLKRLLEEARLEDKESSHRQLDQFRSMFMEELKDINEQFKASQEALAIERGKNQRKGVGNRIFDEDEINQFANMIEKQKKEIDLLRAKLPERTGIEELQLQMSQMKAAHELQIERLKLEMTAKREDRTNPRQPPPEESPVRKIDKRKDVRSQNEELPVGKRMKQKIEEPTKIDHGMRPPANISFNSSSKPKRAKWDEDAHESKMLQMRSQMLNDSNFMEEVREECLQSVSSKLVDFGVQHNNNAMSEEEFSRVNRSMSIVQDKFSQKNPSFFQIRSILKDRLEQQFRTSISRRLTPNPRPIQQEEEPQEVVTRIVRERTNPVSVQQLDKRSRSKLAGEKEEEEEKEEDDDDDALPKGTIPFIAHAVPEIMTFGMGSPKNQSEKSRFNLNINNNNSADGVNNVKKDHTPNNNNNNTTNNNTNNNNNNNANENGSSSNQSNGNARPELSHSANTRSDDSAHDDDYDDDDDDNEDDDEEDEEEDEKEERENEEADDNDAFRGKRVTSKGERKRQTDEISVTQNIAPTPQPRSLGIRLPATGNDDSESVSESKEEVEEKRDDVGAAASLIIRDSASPSSDLKGSSSSIVGAGGNVRNLRDKIQQQLNQRGDVKKPSGGVDVTGGGGVGGGKEDEQQGVPVAAPRSRRERKSSSGWEDDDDDEDEDSFTVSSLEGQSHGRGALKLPPSSSFAGASSTLTSSGDAGAASTSQWGGSSGAGYGSSGGIYGSSGGAGVLDGGGATRGSERKSVVDVVDWDSDY